MTAWSQSQTFYLESCHIEKIYQLGVQYVISRFSVNLHTACCNGMRRETWKHLLHMLLLCDSFCSLKEVVIRIFLRPKDCRRPLMGYWASSTHHARHPPQPGTDTESVDKWWTGIEDRRGAVCFAMPGWENCQSMLGSTAKNGKGHFIQRVNELKCLLWLPLE